MSAQKSNILNYLPPQQKQRVLLLIQRLQQQTQNKTKYLNLYSKMKQEYDQLQQRYNKLKDENAYLKQQMHNSFTMISQVRANFKANKQKLSSQKKEIDNEWIDQDNIDDEENHQNTSNQYNITMQPPKPSKKGSLEKYKPKMMGSDQKNGSVLNISNSFLNNTALHSGSKNRQLDQLKSSLKALKMDTQKKEEKALQIRDKYRLVDQIKNRYRSQQGCISSSQINRSQQKIDITDAFDNEDQQYIPVKSPIKKVTQNPRQPKPIQKKQLPTKAPKQKKIQQKAQPKQSSYRSPQYPKQDYDSVLDLINDYNL